MTSFFIQDREIGDHLPPLIIAEIGINHEGSLDTAITMVDAAHSAGAEIIKHQTHIVGDEMSSTAKKVIPGNADVSIFEIMERCALSESSEIELKRYVEEKGMIFLSTPFSRAAADRLHKMNLSCYKIGSGECNNYPLLKHVASFGKPIILSTGMNNIESIAKSVEIFRAARIPYALLHCTNVYPTPHRLVRLGAMQQLKQEFPDAVVGLSDHTISNNACRAAITLGAGIVERHFTDSMNRPGPDIICSMDTAALSELIQDSKEIFACLGGRKGAVPEEQPTIDFAFATVVTTKPMRQGDTFDMDNTWVKRPGTGEIPADQFESLLGKVAAHDLDADIHLKWTDIE